MRHFNYFFICNFLAHNLLSVSPVENNRVVSPGLFYRVLNNLYLPWWYYPSHNRPHNHRVCNFISCYTSFNSRKLFTAVYAFYQLMQPAFNAYNYTFQSHIPKTRLQQRPPLRRKVLQPLFLIPRSINSSAFCMGHCVA